MPKTCLLAHSEFSLLAGVPPIPALVSHAKRLGYQSLALTDTNRMSGLILFYEECIQQGIKPILGVDLQETSDPAYHVTLLARNDEGYGDLCELITRQQMQGAGFSFKEHFQKPWPNLFLLSTSLKALKLLCKCPNRDRLYGSLIRHSPEGRMNSREVEAFCNQEGISLVAVGDSWFLEKKEHEIHRILRAIDLNSTLSRLRPGETQPEGAWLRSPAEMESLFNDRIDALGLADSLGGNAIPNLQWENG